MRNIKYLFILYILTAALNLTAQSVDRLNYINRYLETAIEERLKYKIPVSITLAQGAIESGNGKSTLSKRSNNHFGIKCGSSWKGRKVYHHDDKANECFRVYKSAWESYRDHSKFLTVNQRYGDLFKLKISDYKGWAKGLKKAGYATNPSYPNLLIGIIEQYDLDKYDRMSESALRKIAGDKSTKHTNTSNTAKNGNKPAYTPVKLKKIRRPNKINGVKYIITPCKITYSDIAKTYRLEVEEILFFNDVSKNYIVPAGIKVFIQKKKRKATKGTEFHTLREGETLWNVSQNYGVRYIRLLRMNKIKTAATLKVGTKIKLR